MEKNTNSNLIIIYICLILLFGLIICYCIKCYNKFTLYYNIRNPIKEITDTTDTINNPINNKK